MNAMHAAVESRPVEQPVNEVEVGRCQDRQSQEPRDKEDRMVADQGKGRDHSVGRAPEIEHLIDRPDRRPTGKGPEDIVPKLVSERVFSALVQLLARVVLQPVPLQSVGKKIEM